MDKDNLHGIQQGLYPQQVIEETQEDLENFVNQLESFGIKVRRPKPQNQEEYFSSPHWDTNGYYNYCPRDSVLIVGDTIIESPVPSFTIF